MNLVYAFKKTVLLSFILAIILLIYHNQMYDTFLQEQASRTESKSTTVQHQKDQTTVKPLSTSQVPPIAEKNHLLLYVAILSAAKYVARRNILRKSWMKQCSIERKVVCKFFTDSLDQYGKPINSSEIDELQKESSKNNNDLAIVASPRGYNYAVRYLEVIQYASREADFDFLLRVDDDQYVCMDRLIQELPHRPKQGLYWGWQRCRGSVTSIDDGWLLLSGDLKYFIDNLDKLMCLKGGDQSVAIWVEQWEKTNKKLDWFADNKRILHDPPVAQRMSEFRKRDEICHTFIALHGAYQNGQIDDQIILNDIFLKENTTAQYYIPRITNNCPRKKYIWQLLRPPWASVPRPCSQFPIWSDHGVFPGRTGGAFRKK